VVAVLGMTRRGFDPETELAQLASDLHGGQPPAALAAKYTILLTWAVHELTGETRASGQTIAWLTWALVGFTLVLVVLTAALVYREFAR
jgi:hypothetical protein